MTTDELDAALRTQYDAVRMALGVLVHAIADQTDAALLLVTLQNGAHFRQSHGATDEFNRLMLQMMVAASNAALKQRPTDPGVLSMYRQLRDETEH